MSQKDDPERRIAGNYPLRFEMRVVFGDVDALRHINNIATARFLEEGRAELNMRVFGRDALMAPAEGRQLLFAGIAIDYVRQAHYPGTVEIATAIHRIGNTSFGMLQAGFQNGECFVLAVSTVVKAMGGRPTLLEAEEREACAPYFWRGGK